MTNTVHVAFAPEPSEPLLDNINPDLIILEEEKFITGKIKESEGLDAFSLPEENPQKEEMLEKLIMDKSRNAFETANRRTLIVARKPAYTLAGLQAKARLFRIMGAEDFIHDDIVNKASKALMLSIIMDILAGVEV